MTTKKTHLADVADLAPIAACKTFTATILKDKKQQTTEHDSLDAARIEAAKLNATSNNGRKALVYAITDDGRAILVPASYAKADNKAAAKQPKTSAPSDADIAAAKQEAAERAKVKAKAKAEKPKAAKPAKKAKKANKAKATKPAAKKDGGSVIAMLTGKKAVTRKDIAEATDWPSINIKAICARKGMKLKKSADGILSATAPAAK
jgi:hypothetical protein